MKKNITIQDSMDSTEPDTISKVDVSELSYSKEKKDSIKDTRMIKEETDTFPTTNLTLYKKPIFIREDNEVSFLNFIPNRSSYKEKFKIVELVYECIVAPTKVFIGENKETGELVAIKETVKSKLSKDFLYEFLYNELAVSRFLSQITHSVVQVYDYYEELDSFIIIMELCDRPNFFEELLENVSKLT